METRLSDVIKGLGLPLDKVIVTGSGILDVLGIRQTRDIDLIVTPDVFADLKARPGAVCEQTATGERVLNASAGGDTIETWLNWHDYKMGEDMYFDELQQYTEIIDGIAYLSLAYLREWKQGTGREKDRADVQLIDNYLEAAHGR